MDPAGKVAVISGGASGLGLALGQALAAKGARVVALDLQSAPDPQIASISCNVADDHAVAAAVARVKARFGTVHILGNCAGIGGLGPIATPAGPGDMAGFARVIGVNLMGAVHLTAHAAPLMMANEPSGPDGERGVILNACSIASFEGQEGMGSYTASKAALAGLVLVWARDLSRHHIRCMGIAPGLMATPMTAGIPPALAEELLETVEYPRRAGTAEEFARLAVFVVENPLMNGDVIRLDGACRPPARTRWGAGA